jgi:hypothetical protein
MFRKLILAIGATAVVAAAALSPTAASAKSWKHHHHYKHGWHGGYGFGFYGPAYVAGPRCYLVRRVVFTPYGKRLRRVTVCD